MSKFRNIKVYVPTPEISEAVQKVLFEDGCRWEFNGKGVEGERLPFLYVDKYGDIRWGLCGSVFNGDGRKEVPYQSILDPYYDVKIAWANGEVVQYKTITGEWVDWARESSISLNISECWRIKPKTKTIKQWERKYGDGLYVCTMKSLDETPHWSEKLNWIGDAYEAEYEVPND